MNDSYGFGRDRGDRAPGGRGYSGRQDNPSRYSERPGGRPQSNYDDALESVQRHSVVNGTVLHEDDDGGIIVQINGARFEGKVSETELRHLPPEMQTDLREEGHTCEFFVRRTPARNSQPDEPMYYDLTITGLWREEDWRLAEDALRSGDVFPAVPTKYNKGGLLVRFGRMLEGFVPISHIWNFPSFREPEQREEALNRWVNEGEEMMVKVIEVTRDKRKLVLSNKEAILDRNREDKAALFETLQVGDVVEGTVRNIRDFGAFVDIGGVEGLLHISEIDWDLVRHPSDYLQEGQVLEVKVLHIDREKGRVKLSRKALAPTPWKTVPERYNVGQVVWVDITKKKDFGAFAKLEPGVEGLIHVSEVAPKAERNPMVTINEGDRLEVEIIRIDAANQRIGLSRARVLNASSGWSASGEFDDDYDDYDDY